MTEEKNILHNPYIRIVMYTVVLGLISYVSYDVGERNGQIKQCLELDMNKLVNGECISDFELDQRVELKNKNKYIGKFLDKLELKNATT